MLSSCDRALHSQLPLFTAFLKLFRTHLEQVFGSRLHYREKVFNYEQHSNC